MLLYTDKISSFNNFFEFIHLKKQYINKLKNLLFLLNSLKEKNYKKLNTFNNLNICTFKKHYSFKVKYIICISFSNSNTLFNVMDFSGNSKFFYSAGSFKYRGKKKKIRISVFNDFYNLLVTRIDVVEKPSLALHLKNVGSGRFWIIKKLIKTFYIKSVKCFNTYPYNGCRKKKVKRK